MTDNKSTVIDGLIFFSDGDPTPLLEGKVDAVNLTSIPPLAGLVEAVDETAVWLRRLREPGSMWKLVRTVADIGTAKEEGKVGLIMGWQNILPIENRISRLALFHELGVRVIQLSYNEASLVADGCLEERQGGLTSFGRSVVKEMNRLGIAIDLSHCSERTALDAAEVTTKPLLITHANAKSVFEQPRNKSDKVIRVIAETGGVIGLSIHGFMNWDGDAAHPASLRGFVDNVKHVYDLVGIDHIGIGTDFSSLSNSRAADFFLEMSHDKYPGTAGAYIQAFGNTLEGRYPADVPTPRKYPLIHNALSDAGFSDDEVAKIAGDNFLRAFEKIW